jgi:hypothetical protein
MKLKLKLFLIITLVFFPLGFIFSCVFLESLRPDLETISSSPSVPTMREQNSAGYWIFRPANGKLTVIGISNRMLRQNDEITAAKEDAAKKVAMFYGARGKVERISSTGSGNYDSTIFASNSEITYTANYENFIEQLTYNAETDLIRTNNGVFIRFQHDTAAANIDYTARYENNHPTWTRNEDMPRVNGYISAVGISQNQRRMKDTIFKATENAIIQMVEQISVAINTRDFTAAGEGSLSTILSQSEGQVVNFQVIEIWTDPNTRYVYVLAIARAAG